MSLLVSSWSTVTRLRGHGGAAGWRRPRAARWLASLLAIAVTTIVVIAVATKTDQNPALYRPLAAVLITGGLILLAARRPMAAIHATVVFLALLALIRRLLIPAAGWTSYDPLLLVAPAVSAFLFLRSFITRERGRLDTLSKSVLVLLFLTILEAGNPLGTGLLSGLGGLLFLAAPLLWYFVGGMVADRRSIQVVLGTVLMLGVGIAIYGLSQNAVGLPPWDAQWVGLGGYGALFVHVDLPVTRVLRAFGTFSSSGEYATYLGIALVIAVASVLHRRVLAVLAIPILGVAVFLDSSRGIVILVFLAFVVLAGLRTRKLGLGLMIVMLGIAGALVAAQTVGQSLEANAVSSSNVLVVHQVEGLVHPLDPTSSTLFRHWEGLLGAVKHGFQNPLGLGTGITTIAGDKLGTGSSGTELDVTNELVSLGLLGGFVFMLIIVTAFRRLIALYLRDHDLAAACAIGVLIVTLGQWLNGGQYAVAPLVWLLIGWGNREWQRR
jgi:hypothetical protein